MANQACCTNLPGPTPSSAPSGSYTTIAGLHTYTTSGSESSPTRAIILIHDIFGLAPQTLLGADLLAASAKALVLVPDFFHGEPLSVDQLPVDSEEKRTGFMKFMAEKADLEKNGTVLRRVREEAGGRFLEVEKWGVLGLCWGGKLVALASAPGSVFAASGMAHPAQLATEDAANTAIPHCCLFSKEDGTPELIEEYTKALQSSSCASEIVVEKYGDMIHGWMGARADLSGNHCTTEFQRGYKQMATFFEKHL
ncbi:dienelactone hydrolase [Saccharata proteae CBS 121410]|uniref:Dienelactone hydrolase n=1 Tax=Saccharata proteae CBS 121410 TaxID=1314787 RepID=A0A9P4HVP8_9PEZI|nr:dienelactone hydrolase [Saccharata proteae CBS 121410]